MNAASPPRRASSRIDIPHDGESLAGEDESGCAGPELRVRDVLEDSPATAALLKQACSAAEAAGTLVQKALRRAAVLRETLRVAGTQRAELVQALRALEAVYASSDDAAAVLSGGFRAVVDSIEDVNRVMALDEYHLASIVIEPLQSLAEQPTVVRNAFKNVTKLRSAMESLADKVAATDRKEATANAKDLQKQDEVKQEFSEGVGRYRKALLDYSMTVTRMQTERKHRMLRQLLAFWLSQRAQVKSMEQMQGDVEPFIRTTVAHLDAVELRAKKEYSASLEERRALEETAHFQHGHVDGNALAGADVACRGWLWRRGTGKLGMWTRRYFRIAGGQLQQLGAATESIPLVTARVKVAQENDRRNCFSVIGPGCEWLLQAHSVADRATWMAALEAETVRLLNATLVETSAASRGEQRQGGADSLLELYRLDAGNAVCCDCGSASPEWAVINLGSLVCIQCSGTHRALGVQYSKVRSFKLDAWSEGELAVMQRLGNTRAASVLEARALPLPKPTPQSTTGEREGYAASKYVRREGLAPLGPGENATELLLATLKDAGNAVHGDYLVSVLRLLLSGADPNGRLSATQETPLLCASMLGDLASLELLLMHGADVKLQGNRGWSALHHLAYRGDARGCSLLFKRGSDPHCKNNDGQTAAELAAAQGNADCVTLLRLAALSLDEKGSIKDLNSFSTVLDDFCRGLKERRNNQAQ